MTIAIPEPAGSASTEQLRREVAELRHELALLREDLRREVRTERLAVVDPVDGRELVWTDRSDSAIVVRVSRAGNLPGWSGTVVSLLSSDELDDGHGAVYLSTGGNIAAILEAYAAQVDGERGDGRAFLALEDHRAARTGNVPEPAGRLDIDPSGIAHWLAGVEVGRAVFQHTRIEGRK